MNNRAAARRVLGKHIQGVLETHEHFGASSVLVQRLFPERGDDLKLALDTFAEEYGLSWRFLGDGEFGVCFDLLPKTETEPMLYVDMRHETDMRHFAEYLTSLSDLQLVALQSDARHVNDQATLKYVLEELGRRQTDLLRRG